MPSWTSDIQPPHKRLRAGEGQRSVSDCGANISADGSCSSPRSSPSSSSRGGDDSRNDSDDKLSAISLNFFADLDDWLEECDDAPVIPSPMLLRDTDLLDISTAFEAGGPLAEPLSTPSKQQECVDPPTRGTSSTRPKPKNSTQRQKEELAYLRSKVSELEAQLKQLKRDRLRLGRAVNGSSDARVARPEHSNDTNDAKGEWSSTKSTSLWESIAKNQQEAAFQAESERAQLQAMLKAQLKLARSLERLLCKPQVWDQLQKPHWRKSVLRSKCDADIFGELLRSVEARYPLLESTLEAKELARSCQSVSDIKLHYASADGICVENRQANVMPFDFDLVIEVLWQSLLQGKIGMFDCPSTIVEHSADIVFIKSSIERPPVLVKPVTAYRVVKRFVSADCVRLVVEVALATTESSESQIPPLQVVHQGWGRLSPVTLDDGTVGTVFQVFASSVLTILEPEGGLSSAHEDKTRHLEIDILSELIMSAYREKQPLVRRELESVLLDATLSRRMRTGR